MNKKVTNKLTMLSIVAVGMLFIIIGLFYSSFAVVEPVRSISFTSEKLNYSEKESGSWKVKKSAKWTSQGKARITFDIDTILKTEEKNTDIIFVLDISGSMSGEKLERVKQDSIELINTLLSNPDNQAALITFETKSEILSEFTHDKDALVNLVNNLSQKGTTNYYQALINVDTILKNYSPSSNDRNCIVLFLTDGYPNEDVPNEESYFRYLKQEYPYIVVNGIQYEMGQDILNPIKKVSDHQYIADMDTLNNVLFDASIVPIPYDNFVLTDYIDTDNFTVESSNDIKVSQGKIDFNKEEQKITWTIDYLRTGSKLTMTIDALLKEEAKTKELLPTNQKETVISKIDKQEETIESDKTPILKDHYQVIYEGNTPSGCNVSNVPSTKSYKIFDSVEISDMIPSCEGYQFKEWQIVTPYVKRISSDYFEMPESDVVLRAVWTNLSLVKSMNGEVYKYIPPVLRTVSFNDRNDIWQYKSSITKVVFQGEIKSIPEATQTFDISAEKNGGVMGYLVPNTDNTSTYTAYIQGDEGVIANQNSSYLFYGFSTLQSIEGLEYFDTSKVTNMSSMFSGCYSLTSLDLSNFDTSKVTNMVSMFQDCRSLTGLNLNDFNTSNVTNMSYMFESCSSLPSLDVSHFDTSNVTNMIAMFRSCSSLPSLDVSHFDTSNVTNMIVMFRSCSSLTNLDLSNFDTSKVTNMSSMFESCSSLTSLDVSNFNTSEVKDMSYMFESCSSLPSLDVSHFDTSNVTNMIAMFRSCSSLPSLNLSNFNTSSVTTMGGMFSSCSSLPSLDVSNFDTSKVTSMSSMFSNCSSLPSLNVSNFDTSKVTDMYRMFYNCSSLTSLDLSSFNTSSVIDMSSMFESCSSLPSLDLSHFNTSKVTNMSSMFSHCSSLLSLDLSNFDTSKVITMKYMFSHCSSLSSLGLSNFDTSKVTNMSSMFESCSKLTSLDISHIDTSKVTNMSSMFEFCRSLTTSINIYNPSVSSYIGMFNGAATTSDAQITVNYIESTSTLVDSMIGTKSSNSNVVKGVNVDHNITIAGNDNIVSNVNSGYPSQLITLSSVSGNYFVTSFKMNGTLVSGNQFTMPDIDVTITDIEVVEVTIIESEHNPYPNSLNSKVYGEKIFEGATSLTVILDYQTQGTSYDWIYLYDSSGKQYGKYGGTTRKTETITIPGNYIKVVFQTNSSGNNYYGFKATVVPNYD